MFQQDAPSRHSAKEAMRIMEAGHLFSIIRRT